MNDPTRTPAATTPGVTPANDGERGKFLGLRDVRTFQTGAAKSGEDKVRHHMTTITRTMFDAYAAFRPPGEWSPTDDLYRDALVSWLLSIVPQEHIPTASRHLAGERK